MVKKNTAIQNYLLSICIPTYNRATVLKESLRSLVEQECFSEVELVISDNCSTDDTQSVVEEYAKKYSNIRYFRNEENVHDQNFPLALMRATGEYRKLFSDSWSYEDGALSYLLNLVREHRNDKPFLFFENGILLKDKRRDLIFASNLSEFLNYVSCRITWISGFGLWAEDCVQLDKEFEWCSTFLWQVYKACKVISAKKRSVISSRKILSAASSLKDFEKNKDRSYGVYKVFYENYFNILKPYIDDGSIDTDCAKKLKKDVLYGQFLELFVAIPLQNENVGSETNYKRLVRDAYKNEPYYLHFCIAYRIKYVLEIIRQKREARLVALKSRTADSLIIRFLLMIKRKLHIKLY